MRASTMHIPQCSEHNAHTMRSSAHLHLHAHQATHAAQAHPWRASTARTACSLPRARCLALRVSRPLPSSPPLTLLAAAALGLRAQAAQVDKPAHKDIWLAAVPKAKLYYDFTDFVMFRLAPTGIDLNGGFGKAYRLRADEL